MFAVYAWSQVTHKHNETKTQRLEVFTRIGGKFLGWVKIKKKHTSLIRRVKDLQAQVARIFRHPTRPSDYLTLFVDNFELPSFTYYAECPLDIELKATSKLLGAPERLECMYNEDDSQILEKLASQYTGLARTRHTIYTRGDLVPELRVLKYARDPKKFEVIHSQFPKRLRVDLSVLASFTNLIDLTLIGICVESWEFAKHLPLKLLKLDSCDFPSLVAKCFPSLEEVRVYLHDATNFVLLERPVNLKTITFLGETRPSLDTLRSLSTSFPDLNVVHLKEWA
jgi:hypothetical protein